MKTKITLIGMPSSGKTTVAKSLAKQLGYVFIDLDHMVEEKEGKSIAQIFEENGVTYFLDMQYSILQNLPSDQNTVISPAGSIIYHDLAMKWLKENTSICLIETSFETIEQRLIVYPKAIAGLKEKGLQTLWNERMPVYKQWADVSVESLDKNPEDIAQEINSKF